MRAPRLVDHERCVVRVRHVGERGDVGHGAEVRRRHDERADRLRVRLSGPDRAKCLHNLTTNDVKRLPVGSGCEAFVTSPQGKTLGHVVLLACDDRVLLRADPGGLSSVLPHLQKYGIFDEVALDGEVVPLQTPLRYRVRPRALRVLVPPPSPPA